MDPQLRELQLVFIEEARQFLADAEETLLALDSQGFDQELINKAFRLAHNFKGSSRSVGFSELGRLAHRYEDILSALKKKEREMTPEIISALLVCNDRLRHEINAVHSNPDHTTSVDNDLAALESVLNQSQVTNPADVVQQTDGVTSNPLAEGFGFFDDPPHGIVAVPKMGSHGVTVRPMAAAQGRPGQAGASSAKQGGAHGEEMLRVPANRLDYLLNIIGELVVNQSILDDCRSREDTSSDVAKNSIGYMSKLIGDLQKLSLSLRLAPIKPLFQKLRRTARDVAASLGKEVELIEVGDYCELDKGVIERIADPLNHMVRNAMDHGVDTKEERIALGKSPVATVRLEAMSLDDHVKIIVSDDGRGLNKEKILAKAIANQVVMPGQALTDPEIFALIFAPGFSTKEVVTDVSGRGVGMEVVQKAVEELKGSISIESEPGAGTRFEISLPLSLSIIGGMVIQVTGQKFIVPVSQLLETIELNKYQVETVTGHGRVLNLRGTVVPVYRLGSLLNLSNRQSDMQKDVAHVAGSAGQGIITLYRGRKVAFEVDHVVNQQKVVLKHLGKEFDGLPGILGGAVLSSGEPGLVISLEGLLGTVAA
jgi:two-component system chemotaxis sensor kinase CheA